MPNLVRHAGYGFLRSIARYEVNTGTVECAGNGLGEKRPIVTGVVPSQTTLITRRKPKLFHEIHRGAGLLAVDRDFAFLVHLQATTGPEHGIGKASSITERKPQRLANVHTKLFQFLAGREVLFPGVGQFVDPHLLENILAIRICTTSKKVRHTADDAVNRHRISDERIKFVTSEI